VKEAFTELTWDDLEAWAGTKVVSRGKSYKQAVEDLRTTPEGGVVAWVQGTHRYATHVWMGKGKLLSACTCPYSWGPCKHAVAVILVLLGAAKAKKPLLTVKESDRRLKLLRATADGLDVDDEDGWDDEVQDIENDDEPLETSPTSKRSRGGGSGRRRGSSESDGRSGRILREHFEAMSKKDLVAFAVEQARMQKDLGRGIVEAAQLKGGKIRKLVASLRDEIEDLTREPAWVNGWTGEGEVSDYTGVQKRLAALVEAGHADEVVSLGKDLWRLGNRQIGQSDDEGETANRIRVCMDTVLSAVHRSTQSPTDRLMLIIETCLADEYSCLGTQWYEPKGEAYGREAWGHVAQALEGRLEKLPKPRGGDSFSARYGREQILRWLIVAYERAGQGREVIPLLEREAPLTLCYEELVGRLRTAKRLKDAERWAIEGFRATVAQWSGIAWKLEEQLRDMAGARKNWPAVGAYRAWEFFDQPSLDRYKSLRDAAEKFEVWDRVRAGTLEFLRTGIRPDVAMKTTKKGRESAATWPLPALEIDPAPSGKNAGRGFARSFPDTGTLIDIAIYEERNEEVVRLYEASRKDRFGGVGRGEAVANAVKSTHPEISLGIWKRLAEAQIAVVKPSAYEQAAIYLRPMRALYGKLGRSAQWQAYLQELRTRHKAKRSLMRVLDKLEGAGQTPKRIIDE
jgi:uncharacterized Zn finger protein